MEVHHGALDRLLICLYDPVRNVPMAMSSLPIRSCPVDLELTLPEPRAAERRPWSREP